MSETTELHVPETMHIEPEPPVETPLQPEGERQLTPREQMMERIVANREAQIQEELEAFGEMTDTPAAPLEDSRAAHAAAEPERAPQAPPVAERRRVVTVGANQFNVTDAEYDHLASIGALAQIAVHQDQQQRQQAYVPPPQPQQYQPPATHRLPGAAVRGAYAAIAYGSEEEGTRALQDLFNASHTSARQGAVADTLQTIELNQNLGIIGHEYPDIFQDRLRSQLAALQLHDLRQRNAYFGRQQDNLSLYREACNNVRGALGIAPPTQARPAVSPDRIERKRGAPRTPASTATRAIASEASRAAPSGSETVDWMRRTRGQSSLR